LFDIIPPEPKTVPKKYIRKYQVPAAPVRCGELQRRPHLPPIEHPERAGQRRKRRRWVRVKSGEKFLRPVGEYCAGSSSTVSARYPTSPCGMKVVGTYARAAAQFGMDRFQEQHWAALEQQVDLSARGTPSPLQTPAPATQEPHRTERPVDRFYRRDEKPRWLGNRKGWFDR